MKKRLAFKFLAGTLVLALLYCAGCTEQPNNQNQNSNQNGRKTTAPAEPVKETEAMENQSPESTPAANPRVKLTTSMGEIVIELNPQKAPITTENFLRYVNEKFYDGTIFHRVIPSFMIQGGGFTPGMNQKTTHAQIKNEASNGLKNDHGTIAMARSPDPDSASSQFFINHKDNDFLNYAGPANPGYAVFGQVVEGMDTVDKIAQVPTGNVGGHGDVPKTDVVITSAVVLAE